MTDEQRAALADRIKTAHDTAPRREAWLAAAGAVAQELAELNAYIEWLESPADTSPEAIRAIYQEAQRNALL